MNTAARSLNHNQVEIDSFFAGLISRRHRSVIILAFAVFLSGFGILMAKNQQRALYIETENLARETTSIQTEWGQLLLEESTLSMPARVERIATDKLGMVVPNQKAIIMVQQ